MLTTSSSKTKTTHSWRSIWVLLVLTLLATAAIYWPGLSGSWLLDDYSSIVNNQALRVDDWQLASWLNAAMSSTTSPIKRPLASLSFALNYRATGLDPFGMKLTNLIIHLINGLLVFVLARVMLQVNFKSFSADSSLGEDDQFRIGITAVLVSAAWMLLPINITGVLYVVQRMESLANVFVLIGLLGYVVGRRRMLDSDSSASGKIPDKLGLMLCVTSVTVPVVIGLLAKETAAMLPLYALIIEWVLFHGRRLKTVHAPLHDGGASTRSTYDWRILSLFTATLILPLIAGLAWLIPLVLKPSSWATRDFTLSTRLLSEARIVLDYIQWTLLPNSNALSFYHDDFLISTGWLHPWTTSISVLGVGALLMLAVWLRPRLPMVSLGLGLFFGAQLMTGTIFPLELIYEHRNYFASFGLLLALIPLLTAPAEWPRALNVVKYSEDGAELSESLPPSGWTGKLPYKRLRYSLLAVLLLAWTMQTALGAYVWGSPLRLAVTLAERSPNSPRAQYELGRTYSAYTQYNPSSSFAPLAYATLEKAAAIPGASILPEQALIFMNARMKKPVEDSWWDSMTAKLRAHAPTAEDASALRTLSTCAITYRCNLSKSRMVDAFAAALAHPNPAAQLQARYGEYAWNVLSDKSLGERMMASAVLTDPKEPDYYVAWIHMLSMQGRTAEAAVLLQRLQLLNKTGRLDTTIDALRALPGLK